MHRRTATNDVRLAVARVIDWANCLSLQQDLECWIIQVNIPNSYACLYTLAVSTEYIYIYRKCCGFGHDHQFIHDCVLQSFLECPFLLFHVQHFNQTNNVLCGCYLTDLQQQQQRQQAKKTDRIEFSKNLLNMKLW